MPTFAQKSLVILNAYLCTKEFGNLECLPLPKRVWSSAKKSPCYKSLDGCTISGKNMGENLLTHSL